MIAAVFFGWQVAEGSYGLPALACTVTVAAVLVRLTRLPVDAILFGFLIIGYVVGNRGFAQLMPVAGLPLLPAEIGLMVGVVWLVLVCAFARRLPFRTDALNWLVLGWLVLGTARVVFDVPRYGFLAVRDYAMIYYAVFFFLAQQMGRDPKVRRYLETCCLVAVILLVPAYGIFQLSPNFYFNYLTIRGVPLIHYKDDLALTFFGVGSILLFHWAEGARRYWAWPLSATMALCVMAGGNRASMLGLVVASLLLLLARRWRFPALQGALGGASLAVLIALATLFNNTWAERKLDGITERIQSITDVSGSGRYDSDESFNKGDNNRYRLVWWKNVVLETWDTNPVFGLGFGADLARGFVQEYYPEVGEFSVRSPHNMFLTAFGRMGAVGLLAWLALCTALLARTWAGLRRSEDPVLWALWVSAWAILVSATLGVVLEGPMGAVVFWIILGLANSHAAVTAPAPAEKRESPAAAALPAGTPAA